jgi:hypothetical protein
MSPPFTGLLSSASACCVFRAGLLLGLLFDPKAGGVCSSEMSVDFHPATGRNIPQYRTLHDHVARTLNPTGKLASLQSVTFCRVDRYSWCTAAGMYIPPTVNSKEVRILDSHNQGLPARSTVRMTELVTLMRLCFWNSSSIFQSIALLTSAYLYWMEKRLVTLWTLWIIVDSMALKSPAYRHTAHVLQPPDGTAYKPLNSWYHLEVSPYSHEHSQASINKSNVGRFSSSENKNLIVGKALKGFQDTINIQIVPLQTQRQVKW